jgi:hypothetical protein
MTGSNKRMSRLGRGRRCATGFTASLVMFAATVGFAQDAPPGNAPSPAAPVSILPAAAEPAEEAPVSQEPTVAVGDLAAPGVDRIGLVDAAAGGFSAQLWYGTDLELLKLTLPQMPRRVTSPAQRRLMKNLLLSPGLPPTVLTHDPATADAASADTNLSASQWLLETRVSLLAGLGAWGDVLALVDLVPSDQMTEGLKRLKTEANLVANYVNAACSQAQAALSQTPDAYWQKIQIFCQINMEQSSAAGLGMALLREQGVADPTFYWAADVLGGGKPPLPATFTRLEPLHFAMLRKANATLPLNIADVQSKISDPATLGWLAALPTPEAVPDKADKTPAAARRQRARAMEEAHILLAERAVAAGTLDPDMLRTVYRKTNIKDPAPPPLSQITASDVRGRALLFQSALAQTVPTARAEVIARALDLVRADRGEKGPSLLVMGRVYAPLVQEIEPTGDLVWFSGTATRVLLAAASSDKTAAVRARVWLELARSMARSSREGGDIAAGLWPMERLSAGSGESVSSQNVRAWAASLPATLSPEEMATRRETLLSLLTATGESVTPADWLPAMSGPAKRDAAIPPHLWNGLALASKDRRAGETAVLALVALGEHGTARTPVLGLQQVIESLRVAGREADARALAAEAALALGL